MPYPMDTRLFFNVCALFSLGLYVLSLVLHVHVVGDFGVSDEGSGAGGSLGPCRALEGFCSVTLSDVTGLLDDTVYRRSSLSFTHQKPK